MFLKQQKLHFSIKALAGLVSAFAFFALVNSNVAARSYHYSSYDVEITVNPDSTMDVTEKLNYVFDGTYSAVTRGILLEDPAVREACYDSGGFTCGGFEYLVITEVKGEGKVLDPNEYTTGIQEDEDSETRYYLVDWEFGSTLFDGNDEVSFEISYRVYGGVQFVQGTPYLYWNALPSDRGAAVDRSTITLNLPQQRVLKDDLKVYANTFTEYLVSANGNQLVIDVENLSPNSDFTLSYGLPADSIEEFAHIKVHGNPFGQKLYIDGVLFGETDFELRNFSAGEHVFRGEFTGYNPKELSINTPPGEYTEIYLTLQPEPWMQILIYVNYLLICLGCLMVPVTFVVVYQIWSTRGRDQSKIATVIPLYEPPVEVHPYTAGALIDETVDKRDITGAIIDLAFRGFLKIKELDPQKNYQLIRVEKDSTSLTPIEVKLLDMLFGSDTEVETKDMGSRFARSYPGLVNDIYKSLVNQGYFQVAPQVTRGLYLGCGIGILIFGIVSIICMLSLGAAMIGQIGPFTLGIALVTLGSGVLVISKFMPAKTTLGSKIYNELAGFKMYLGTAEKYTLQNLKPEDFEKYLSYAVVFGVEEAWAEKFKDLYKDSPDWYEGSSPDVFSTYWLTRSLNSFGNNMESTVFTPTSSGGSGSGWSGGGGGFSGFSGGGGGGGFSGAR